MVGWYAMQSKPQKEFFLNSQLCVNHIESYLPLIKTRNRSGKVSKRPFFPGYMFVHLNLNTIGISEINWIPGSKGLVFYGNQPASVPENFIQQLRNKLEVINTKCDVKPFPHQRGDLISITNGPLKGYQAIFNQYLPEKDRVRLFLIMLSENTIRVEVPVSYLA